MQSLITSDCTPNKKSEKTKASLYLYELKKALWTNAYFAIFIRAIL